MSILTPEEIFKDEQTYHEVNELSDNSYYKVIGNIECYETLFRDVLQNVDNFAQDVENVTGGSVELGFNLNNPNSKNIKDFIQGDWGVFSDFIIKLNGKDVSESVNRLMIEDINFEIRPIFIDWEVVLEEPTESNLTDYLSQAVYDYIEVRIEDESQNTFDNLGYGEIKQVATDNNVTFDTESGEIVSEYYGSFKDLGYYL